MCLPESEPEHCRPWRNPNDSNRHFIVLVKDCLLKWDIHIFLRDRVVCLTVRGYIWHCGNKNSEASCCLKRNLTNMLITKHASVHWIWVWNVSFKTAAVVAISVLGTIRPSADTGEVFAALSLCLWQHSIMRFSGIMSPARGTAWIQ